MEVAKELLEMINEWPHGFLRIHLSEEAQIGAWASRIMSTTFALHVGRGGGMGTQTISPLKQRVCNTQMKLKGVYRQT